VQSGNENCIQYFSQKTSREKLNWNTKVDNSKMNLRELGYEGVDWIQIAEDRVQQ